MRKLFVCLFFLLTTALLAAETPLVLNLTGHQSSERLQVILNQIDSYKGREAVLRLNSGTGDLEFTLKVAQQLSSLKKSQGLKISAYFENRVVGPAALLPFLADSWMGTSVFAWGDIPYGTESPVPKHQLISMVQDLVPQDASNAPLLKMLAAAMIDPMQVLVKKQNWELEEASSPQEPLVLSRYQLSEMGFSPETMHAQDFEQKYGVKEFTPISSALPSPTLQQSLTDHIHYYPDKSNFIGYLHILPDRPIDQSTYLQVKFALEEYVKREVAFVILRLNTPGGDVFSSMKIAELLQELDAVHHIPVIAVVKNWALSAGAMLAYACRYIAVSNTALMGAAEPVFSNGHRDMQPAPEKIVSALRAEFGSLAKFYGRNPLIAEAMVDKDIILVERNGKIVQLQNPSEIKSQGVDADIVISQQGKLLTMDAEQLLNFKVADFLLPVAATHDVTDEELELGEWPASQSQLFSYPFFSQIPFATLVYYSSWKIDFFAFLTNPIVASLLMIGLIVGIYLEMSHPGFGLPGIMALICLGLILLSNFAIETINWLEILTVVLGILLLLTEIFVLPGFGFVGILGIILIFFGLIASMLPNLKSAHFAWNWQEWNLPALEFLNTLAYYLIALVASLVIIAILSRYVTPRLLKKSRIVHEGDQEGSVAGPEKNSLPPTGAEGEAFTSLRPGGKILIGYHLYDALTEGTYIDRGEKVIIVKIDGSAIIVAKK